MYVQVGYLILKCLYCGNGMYGECMCELGIKYQWYVIGVFRQVCMGYLMLGVLFGDSYWLIFFVGNQLGFGGLVVEKM